MARYHQSLCTAVFGMLLLAQVVYSSERNLLQDPVGVNLSILCCIVVCDLVAASTLIIAA